MAVTYSKQPSVKREIGCTKLDNGSPLTYSRVVKDADGWVSAEECSPLKGELMDLQMVDRKTTGWWAGAYWYGPRIKETDCVEKWKPANFDYGID
jgi:hypothetical protein